MRLLLLGALFFCAQAQAGNECQAVDLRPLLGPPMHQGDSGYCFAHASASLIAAKLGVRVSPMHLAANFILANPEELNGLANPEVNGLLTPQMISFWRHERNTEPQNFSSAKILTENGLLNTGGEEAPSLLVANFLGLCPERNLPTGASVYKKYLQDIRAFHDRRVRQGIPEKELSGSIGEVLEPEARAKAWSFRHWVEKHCGGAFRPAVPLLPESVSLAKSLKEFRALQSIGLIAAGIAQNVVVRALDENLDRGTPVSIGYALGDIMPEQATSSVSEVDHASVIAGRRLVGGRCYYYLRNSFGNDSNGYAPRFKGRFEQGGVWILPEEIPSLYSAVWLR